MTPTNDAPVTVEQCDREAAKPFMDQYLDGSSFADDRDDLATAFARHRLAALASAPAEHSDDIAVDRFAAAMKAKLSKARDMGRGGWDVPSQCTVEHLRDLLHSHVAKGDPVDVANFCMMLFHRGGSTSATCRICDGTGYIDHAGYSMDPCGCSKVETAIASAEQEARRHGADSFGGKEFASAPAGDGVSKRPHFMAGSTSSDDPDGVVFRIVTLPPHGPGFWVNRHNRNDALATLEAVYDAGVAAALVRPRAAVGERDLRSIVSEAIAHYDVEPGEMSRASEAVEMIRLALQSPPAKV